MSLWIWLQGVLKWMDLVTRCSEMDAYEAKFHALSRYTTQFVTIKEKRIRLFIRGLNFELQVLSLHMTSAGRRFHKVTDYFKKM